MTDPDETTSDAIAGSTVVETLENAIESSRFVDGFRSVVDTGLTFSRTNRERLESGLATSTVGTETRRVSSSLSTALEASVARSLVDLGIRWVESSYLYRWLTAEPDPEVIVIDLRETWTVGPVLAVLDVVLDYLISVAEDSTTLHWIDRALAWIREAPVRSASFGIASATVGYLALANLFGGLSTTTYLTAGGILILAFLGTRVGLTWSELQETAAVRLLVAVLEPPEPPERNDSEGRTGSDGDRRPPDGGPDTSTTGNEGQSDDRTQ